MKKLKKLIAVVAAASMLLASCITANANTILNGKRYATLFGGTTDNNSTDIKNTTISLSGTNAKLISSSHSSGTYAYIKYRNTMGTSGTHSLDLNAGGSTNYDRDNGGAMVRFVFGQPSSDGNYHISFNMTRFGTDPTDYATLNWDSWNGAARLNSGSKWTKTNLGTGVANGGIGDQEWTKYEADFTSGATGSLEFRIAVYCWARAAIDDVVITDGSGNILFSEDFEGDTVQKEWIYKAVSGNKPAIFEVTTQKDEPSNHVLKVKGYDEGLGSYFINLPQVQDNIYNISYDVKSITDNSISFGFVSNNVFDSTYNVAKKTGVVTKSFNSGGNTMLRLEAKGWAGAEIDNIMIKDKNGNVIYEEDFDGNQRPTSYTDGWTKGGDASSTFKVVDISGNHKLSAKGGGTEGNVGTYKIALPDKAVDNEYHITYEWEKIGSGSGTNASVDLVGNAIYESGQVSKLGSEFVTTSGSDYLYIAVTGWAGVYIDNIVVKDKNNKVLFTEDFENFDEKYTYYVEETKLQGLSANGYDDVIYLSWRNPKRDDIKSIAVFENDVETDSSQLADYYLESNNVNIIEISDNLTGAGTVHNYDVQMTTNDGTVYHNYITGKEGERFLNAGSTKDGTPLQGWRITTADGTTVKALGSVEYDTLNKKEGKASLHINPNITYTSGEQELTSDKVHVMAEYKDGARFRLDTPVYGIEEGKTYKLTWKQKGLHAPHYYAQLLGAELQEIGSFTAQAGFVDTAWQDKELTFTAAALSTTGAPTLRFEFSNGCDGFWLDDMKLVEVGKTQNLLANGSFEYGLDKFKKTDNKVTWELQDTNDSVNVYRKYGDTLIKVDTLSSGTNEYTIPGFDGTNEVLVFRTVKKSGNTEFLSEEYATEYSQNSYIYDAKLEVVKETANGYEVIGTPEKLTGNILLKSTLKLDNAKDTNLIGADLYTMIYKNGALIKIDKQTATAATSVNANYGSIISVPSLTDGQYTAKVFVWKVGEMTPIKNLKQLDE